MKASVKELKKNSTTKAFLIGHFKVQKIYLEKVYRY